jgi:hypothetical protein
MVNRQIDAIAELQNAFQALLKNWVLAIPTGVAALVASAFLVFVVLATVGSLVGAGMMGATGGQQTPNPSALLALAGAGGVTFIVGGVVIFILYLLACAAVMAAAEDVWRGQPADLAKGISKAFGRLGPLLVLFFISIVVGIVCGLLIIALGLGIILAIVLSFFWMYALPAIVISNQGAMQALGTSYRLARQNLAPSLIAFLGIIVVTFVGQIVLGLFKHVPALEIILAFAIGGFTYAFSALVAVRFYDLLSAPVAPATPVARTTP